MMNWIQKHSAIGMRWESLLFIHWPVARKQLETKIPTGLEIDQYQGQCWIGVVPFMMTQVKPVSLGKLQWGLSFPELNVRTYVMHNGKPGVWFFSLDAGNSLAVRTARTFFHLPYFNANMSSTSINDEVHYQSQRTHRNAPPADFVADYHPIGDVYMAEPGSLDHWLTERYCLFSEDDHGNLFRGDIEHAPWPVQKSEARIEHNTMLESHGIQPEKCEPLLHFAKELDVVAQPLLTV